MFGTVYWQVGDEQHRLSLRGQEVIAGRDVRLPIVLGSRYAGRRHFRLWFDDVYRICDLNSRNGTWLDGQRLVRAMELSGLHIVRVGNQSLNIQIVQLHTEDQTVSLSSQPADVSMSSVGRSVSFGCWWRFSWSGFSLGWRHQITDSLGVTGDQTRCKID